MSHPKSILIVMICFAMAGCTSGERTRSISTQSISLAQRSPEADQLWSATNETLRRHRFQLDRVDRRAGVITTMPMTSQNILEFWRHDVDTWHDLWESTFNLIRRKVVVTFENDENGNWSSIAMAVHKERLSSPDRQFNSTGAAYQYFGNALPSTTGKVDLSQEDDRWINEGSDPAMENYLLRKIFGMANMDIESNQVDAEEKSPQPVKP